MLKDGVDEIKQMRQHSRSRLKKDNKSKLKYNNSRETPPLDSGG